MDFGNDKEQQYTIHFDETSPHMHVVGLPVVKISLWDEKGNWKITNIYKKSLSEIQDKMKNECV